MTRQRWMRTLILVLGASCYDPSFPDGTMACSGTDDACPGGFECIAGYCRRAGRDAALDLPEDVADDDAAADGACSRIVPLCTASSTHGACDPVCQSGCPECHRCTINAQGESRCVPAWGTAGEGQPCAVHADGDDECAPGLRCLGNGCYTRCARLCREDSDCGGAGCIVAAGGDYLACDVPPTGCDPVGTAAAFSCPAPLTCYLIGPDQSGCDCPGGDPVPAGRDCTFQRQCIPGYTCISVGSTAQCRPVCSLAHAECPVGTGTCNAYGDPPTTNWGYCAP